MAARILTALLLLVMGGRLAVASASARVEQWAEGGPAVTLLSQDADDSSGDDGANFEIDDSDEDVALPAATGLAVLVPAPPTPRYVADYALRHSQSPPGSLFRPPR